MGACMQRSPNEASGPPGFKNTKNEENNEISTIKIKSSSNNS
jgi:hypothetical protein